MLEDTSVRYIQNMITMTIEINVCHIQYSYSLTLELFGNNHLLSQLTNYMIYDIKYSAEKIIDIYMAVALASRHGNLSLF